MHRESLAVGICLRWTRRLPSAATMPHDVMRDRLTASAFSTLGKLVAIRKVQCALAYSGFHAGISAAVGYNLLRH